jgi:eukaryotic-like serine/threonine-protein kinase
MMSIQVSGPQPIEGKNDVLAKIREGGMGARAPQPIEGKYDVLAKIREGGMGALYLVRHRLLNERRVIKVMRPELAQSAEQQKRFLREAQTATRLKHENIVGFYDFFVDQEGTASMVMEYIEGITLRDMIRTSGALPIALCVRLSSQCLAALDYLHRKGIVHRDISPDNIMTTADEDGALRAKLIDLGIARIAQADEGLTKTGEFLGKLRYSSPEQLLRGPSSKPVDGRSDLFSLGVVIYEMLTGSCPYAAGSLGDILNARIMQPPMPFEKTDRGGKVSEGLRAIVLKALQRKPEDRFQSAAEFGAALNALPVAERAPEDPKEVAQYVSRALQAETKATEVRILPSKSLQPERDSELSSTQIPVNAPLVADDQRPTMYTGPTVVAAAPEATPEPARAEPERKRSRILIFALTAGATLALAASILLITAKGRAAVSGSRTTAPAATVNREPPPARIQPPETRDVAGTVSSGAMASGVAAGTVPVSQAPTSAAAPASLSRDTAAPPAPQQERSAVPVSGPSVERAVEKKEGKRLRPVQEASNTVLKPSAKRPEEQIEKKGRRPVEQATSVLPSGVAEIPQPARPRVRFCSQLEETDYKQLIAKEVAPGFAGTAAKVPREDSGLMQIRIAVSPEHPSEDDPTFVSVRFENGGDNPVQIEQLRESLSRGGYRAVSNALVPATVLPGGFKELHQYQVDLRGGEPYRKQFIVVDKKSDSWRAGFSLLPCAQ